MSNSAYPSSPDRCHRLAAGLAAWWAGTGLIAIALALLAGMWLERSSAGEANRHWQQHLDQLWTGVAALDPAQHTEAFRDLVGQPVRTIWSNGTIAGRQYDVELVGTIVSQRMAGVSQPELDDRRWRLTRFETATGVTVELAEDMTPLLGAAGPIRLLTWCATGLALGVLVVSILIMMRHVAPIDALARALRSMLDRETWEDGLADDAGIELPGLHRDINRLASIAGSAQRGLRDVRASLEQQLVERTAELTNTNSNFNEALDDHAAATERSAATAQNLAEQNEQLELERVGAVDARNDAERTATAQRRDRERLELAIRGSSDGIWDWNLLEDSIYFSPRFEQIVGVEEGVLGQDPGNWFKRLASADLSQFQQAIADHIAGHTDRLQCEIRLHGRDGKVSWALCRGAVARNEQDSAVRLTGSLTDITAMKAAEDSLRHSAEHDRLTGLPNRALLQERLQQMIERGKSDPGYHFAVLFFDFDRFKVINDSLGHKVGDQLLVSVADRLRKFARQRDTVARVGGDEFILLLDGVESEREAILAGERMLNTVAAPHDLDGRRVTTTASIGILMSDRRYDTPAEMIRDADLAMYESKFGGQARCTLFDKQMRLAAMDRMTLAQDLRHALERDELRVLYHPIIRLETGVPHGFEALVRWTHPTRGEIGPDRFIEIAEETGLIHPIGRWILAEACRQLVAWREEFSHFDLTMNVNLSRRQLQHDGFVESVQDIFKETGVLARRVTMEITEDAIMEDNGDLTATLNALRQLGVTLAMDNFGSGQSSLSTLRQFPINELKIDRAFIRNLDHRRSRSSVTEAVVALAHSLDMRVVAEGIEYASQLTHLQQLGCDLAQGYHFARPLEPGAAIAFLASPALIQQAA